MDQRSSSPSAQRDQAINSLQELGLTGGEAEVYFAAVSSGIEKPFSSYRLAREMGRDAANVGKTLDHLVRAGAVQLVQEKPRLFVPVDPASFIERIKRRVAQQSDVAMSLLQRCATPLPDGLTLALDGPRQLLDKARELLADCQHEVVAFGSRESLREIGAELEKVGERPGCAARVLSPVAMVSDNVTIAVISQSPILESLLEHQFLLLVVDNHAWLGGLLDDASSTSPSGWWSVRSPIAPILAGALSQACGSCGPPAPVAATATDPAEHSTGLTFLTRHPTTPEQEKGEL